jgi:hypothetical protein
VQAADCASDVAVREGEQGGDLGADDVKFLNGNIYFCFSLAARGLYQIEARPGAMHEGDAR